MTKPPPSSTVVAADHKTAPARSPVLLHLQLNPTFHTRTSPRPRTKRQPRTMTTAVVLRETIEDYLKLEIANQGPAIRPLLLLLAIMLARHQVSQHVPGNWKRDRLGYVELHSRQALARLGNHKHLESDLSQAFSGLPEVAVRCVLGHVVDSARRRDLNVPELEALRHVKSLTFENVLTVVFPSTDS